MEILWKNSHIIANNIRIIHANFIAIAIIFSGKKLGALLSCYPSHTAMSISSSYFLSHHKQNILNIVYWS
jgi:hypothetical protein